MDNYPQAAAEQRRDKTLAELAWPWARPVGGGGSANSYLDVSTAGMIFTANNQYTTATDDATGNANAWVTNIITDDMEFFSTGKIETNTLQVKRTLDTPARAFDVLMDIVNLGGTGNAPWELFAGETANGANTLNYRAINTDPIYYLIRNQLTTVDGSQQSVAPWAVQPGVVRDLEYPVRSPDYGSWLDTAADMYLEEVTASDRGITWETENYSESALLAAQQDYALMLANMKYEKQPPTLANTKYVQSNE